MPYVWTPRLSVGSPTIDAQHQALFAQATLIEGLLAGQAPATRLLPAFSRFAELTEINFTHEERLMGILGLGEARQHHAEHETIRAQMRAFPLEVAEDPRRLVFLDVFLAQWLPRHISSQDLKLLTAMRAL